jgi:hypothetical protein
MPNSVEWNTAAEAALMDTVAAQLLPMLTQDVFAVAEAIAPVKAAHATYSGGPRPGKLKASVHWSLGQDTIGPYGDVASLWYGWFLDPKARQLHRLYPFLPTALNTALAGRRYYL